MTLNHSMRICSPGVRNWLESKRHPGDQSNTVEQVFTEASKVLRPLGCPFDGYVEKAFRVSPTCLVRLLLH